MSDWKLALLQKPQASGEYPVRMGLDDSFKPVPLWFDADVRLWRPEQPKPETLNDERQLFMHLPALAQWRAPGP